MQTISLQTFFVQAFKIVVDSGKFNMLLLYYEMNDQFLWFQAQKNSNSNNSNTPYKSLIVTADEFQ